MLSLQPSKQICRKLYACANTSMLAQLGSGMKASCGTDTVMNPGICLQADLHLHYQRCKAFQQQAHRQTRAILLPESRLRTVASCSSLSSLNALRTKSAGRFGASGDEGIPASSAMESGTTIGCCASRLLLRVASPKQHMHQSGYYTRSYRINIDNTSNNLCVRNKCN